jgi:hypothetical protein
MFTLCSGVPNTQPEEGRLEFSQASTLPFVAFQLRTVDEFDSDVAQCRSGSKGTRHDGQNLSLLSFRLSPSISHPVCRGTGRRS